MSIRSRTSERVQTVRTGVAERIEALAGTIDKKALYAGIAATFLIGLLSLVVPIIPFFGFVTGGVVGGFIAAYAAGGLVRGIVHGVVAAVVGGIVLAGLGVGQGLLLGFVFIETPTIIGAFTPAVSAVFSRQPLLALVATLVVLPVLVGFDGAVGGVVGSALRWVRDRLA
ncbi:hypothetical protein [Halococcus thailandensis]|uniref:DUF5518 domain-containing protein n=1 Tax=Halococcus thailandensis JCM 13552 TaxID=1227457 RepID=M0MZD9_9EURY|nr:hypothetical protein [Halococcus thailandensis]EMA50219.1 hypothetical protein C451_17010 [Halococcus thailandensis JCM 13552]